MMLINLFSSGFMDNLIFLNSGKINAQYTSGSEEAGSEFIKISSM